MKMMTSIVLATLSAFICQTVVQATTECDAIKCRTTFELCVTDIQDANDLIECHHEKTTCSAPCSVTRKGLRMGGAFMSTTIGKCIHECNMKFDGCGLKTFSAEEVNICVRNHESQCKATCKLSENLQKMKQLRKFEKRLEKINKKMRNILLN